MYMKKAPVGLRFLRMGFLYLRINYADVHMLLLIFIICIFFLPTLILRVCIRSRIFNVILPFEWIATVDHLFGVYPKVLNRLTVGPCLCSLSSEPVANASPPSGGKFVVVETSQTGVCSSVVLINCTCLQCLKHNHTDTSS